MRFDDKRGLRYLFIELPVRKPATSIAGGGADPVFVKGASGFERRSENGFQTEIVDYCLSFRTICIALIFGAKSMRRGR